MGTNCAPLVADLFLFCYERDFMKSLTKEKRYDLIDAFNSTSSSQCWYVSHEPSSLFHHSVLVNLNVSMMMH